MVRERTSVWQGRGGRGSEPSGSLRPGAACSHAPSCAAASGIPLGSPGPSNGHQKQEQQDSTLQSNAIQSNSLRPLQGAWAKPIRPSRQPNQSRAPPGNFKARPGCRDGRGHDYSLGRQAQQSQTLLNAPAASELSDYPEIQRYLAVPRGRGRGSTSPSRSTELRGGPSPGHKSPKGRSDNQSTHSAGRHGRFESNLNDTSQQMLTSTLTDDPHHEQPCRQRSHYTQEPQQLASLHKQEEFTDMVGQYNPNIPDPSHAMMRVAAREWDSDKLEYGCQLLQRGVGVKIAAREAGVLVGDLKAHWEAHYVDAESDDYDDASSDGSPVPR